MKTGTQEYNPRYLAYAKAEGFPDPEEMLAHDRERYPGGKMCGFILWIDAKWSEWATVTGHPRSKDRNAPIWPKDHVVFDAWLEGDAGDGRTTLHVG